jgi:DNA-binding transcriptional MocR family regulator
MKPGHWFWLEKAVVREYLAKVGPSAFAVYCFLATCVDKNQMCFPSQAYIANSLGCSRSTVCRGMDELERMNLIHRGLGTGGRTEYHLLAVDIQARECTDERPMSQPRNDDVAQVDTIYNQEREETNNNADRVRLLARDLAEKLRNPGGTPIYEAYARKYPEQILRRVLAEASEVPDWRITKSRAHLFTFLLKRYV